MIALKQEEEINELIMTEDHIEMSYHLEYCPACNQGGASGMGSVFSLLGCNIYDEHDECDNAAVLGIYGTRESIRTGRSQGTD